MPKKSTQREDVLKYLKENGTITRMDAFLDLGIAELPARICELKKEKYGGHHFIEKRKPFITRLGKRSHYIEYSLAPEPSERQAVNNGAI